MNKFIGLILVLSIPCQIASAGPWLKDTGAGYMKLSTSHFQSDVYMRTPDQPGLSFSSYSLTLYGEVGLPGPFQALIYVPFVMAANHDPNEVAFRNTSFGDARLSLEWAPLHDAHVVVGIDILAPLYKLVSNQDLSGAPELIKERIKFPDVGDGNYVLTARIDGGLSLQFIPGWVKASAGYRKRFNTYVNDTELEYLDGVDLKMELGVWFWPDHAYLSIYSQALLNFEKEPEQSQPLNRETVSFELTLGMTAAPVEKNLHLVLSLGALIHTHDAAPGYSWTVGVAWSWDGPQSP